MDFPSPFCFKSAQDLSNLTATQRELLSDRKSWPEMLSRVQQNVGKPWKSLPPISLCEK